MAGSNAGYINLTSSAAPLDTTMQLTELERKKKLAMQILQASTGLGDDSPTIDAGAYKPVNWAGPLSKALQSFAARASLDDTDKKEKEVAADQIDRDKTAGADFQRNLSGFDVSPMGPGQTEPDKDGNYAPEHVKGDLLRSLTQAMASGSTRWQNIGTEAMKKYTEHQAEGELTDADRAHAISGGHVAPSTTKKPVNEWTPPAQVTSNDSVSMSQPRDAGGNLVGEPTRTPISTYGNPVPAAPGVPAYVRNLITQKPETMGAGQTSMPGNEFNQKLQDLDVETLGKGREESYKAVQGLQLIATATNQMEAIPADKFGMFATTRVGANQLFASLGLGSIPDSVGLERLNSLMGERMIERLKMFAPVSDYDAKKLLEISGSAGNTKEALTAMLQYAEGMFSRTIEKHNDFADKLGKMPGYNNLDRYRVNFSVKGDPAIGLRPGADQSQPAAPAVPPEVKALMDQYLYPHR